MTGYDPKLDQDLQSLDRHSLLGLVIRHRARMRRQVTAKGHDACHWWEEDWKELLPEYKFTDPELPPEDEFLGECKRFHRGLSDLVTRFIKNTNAGEADGNGQGRTGGEETVEAK